MLSSVKNFLSKLTSINIPFISSLRLRNQLVLLSSIGVAIAALGFYYYTIQKQRQLFAEEFDKSTLATLEAVRLGLEVGLTEENYENITTVLNWTKKNETVNFIVLTDSIGEIIASYPETLSVSTEKLKEFSQTLSLKEPLFIRSGEWKSSFFGNGKLYIGFSTAYVRLLEQQALKDVGSVSLLFLIASSIFAFLVALSITHPLEKLREVTEHIAKGNLASRANEKQGSEEVTFVARAFNRMIDALLDSQTQRMSEMKKFNESLEERNEKLTEAISLIELRSVELQKEKEKTEQALLETEEARRELANTLEDLKRAQTQLVQSEKMAALGQLIAGIAHEINTPAGAINSAINEIEKDYVVMLERLVKITENLSPEEAEKYLDVCRLILSLGKDMSTKDQRSIARDMQSKLEEGGIDNARFVSKNLAMIGFTSENVSGIIPLLKTSISQEIQQSLHQLGMSQIQVRDIKIAISRITQIVKALKSYSHLDQEALAVTNLQEDLENTLIILHNKLKRAITVHKEFDSIPPIKCYADQLNQVWTNLIHNSIQAMRGEGIIYLRLKKLNGSEIAVEVEDNGPGIPPEVMPRIFEPYFTTKPKGEGTGLGLSITREIVEKHKGKIEVTSKPGCTRFRIILPLSIELAQAS